MARSALRGIHGLLAVAAVFVATALARAEVYVYPGSFDLFHKTHEEEARMLLARSADAKIWILPVEKAYYQNQIVGGLPRPAFAEYALRRSAIEAALADLGDRVRVDDALRSIPDSVFPRIGAALAEIERRSGEKATLYVGADVLATWEKIPGFADFAGGISLLVGADPSDAAGFLRLREKFAKFPGIRFVDSIGSSVRSFRANQSLLDAAAFDEKARSILAPYFSRREIDFFFRNAEWIRRARASSRVAIDAYLRAYALHFSLPALAANGLPPELARTIADSPGLLEWFSRQRVTDSSSAAIFCSRLVDRLPREARAAPAFAFLYSDFTLAYQKSSSLREAFAGVAGSQLLFEKTAAPKPKTAWSKTADYLAKRAYTALLPIGKAIGVKRMKNFDYPDPPALGAAVAGAVGGEDEIVVYRGVKAKFADPRFLDEWNRKGMLSKTALRKHLEGASLEEGLAESRRRLAEGGYKRAGLNHVLGEWREETSLISTTLDKNIALGAAGEGGIVVTLRLKRKSGIFLNDPILWEGTPWAATGNPFAEAQEFAVFDRIPPEAFVEVEKVVGEVPRGGSQALPGFKKILRSIPGILKAKCRALLAGK